MDTKVNGKSDEDCLFLEQVLDKLYDFGTKKKKKRKRCSEDDAVTIKPTQQQHQSEQTDVSGKDHQVEVVTFQDPRKKIKAKDTAAPEKLKLPQIKDTNSDTSEVLNLETARLEVHRFGITGYKKEQQRVFEQDRAVMLGARPPKKQYVNYKVLQQQVKDKKLKEKEEVDPDLKKKKKQNKNSKDKKKQPTSGSGSGPSGQVGRFKNGVLILSSKEIQKIKGTKRKR
ncbi:uncharacterized protein C1orf131 homolog [Eucyclogobius newberryi]|uniref:uncharacterized protein C1orf131 homolog n=1 Tax=Eucyclogobius newberryi TaxID=166745 RepID=UPI003B5C10B4